MKILKKGRQENKKTKTFTCQKCGCEFTAEEDEYAEKYNVLLTTQKEFVCSCPECHKIVSLSEVNDFGYTWMDGNKTSDGNNLWITTGTVETPAVCTVSSGYAPSCTTVVTSNASYTENKISTANAQQKNSITSIDSAKTLRNDTSGITVSASNVVKKSSKVKNERT